MNSSSDRWNKFPWLAGLAFATCALTLGTTLVVAQETTVLKRAPRGRRGSGRPGSWTGSGRGCMG